MTIPYFLRTIPETARILKQSATTLHMLIEHELISVIHILPDAPAFIPLFEAAYAVRMLERRGLGQAKIIAERKMVSPDEVDAEEVAYARGVIDGYTAAGAKPDPMPNPYRPRRRTRSKIR